MKKVMDTPATGQIIASTMSPEEYNELSKRGTRLLENIPEKWRSKPRSRTVAELFRSMDECFAMVASTTRKKTSF